MKRDLGKEKREAKEGAPMDVTGLKDARVQNQTTMVPKKKFPWMVIIMLLLLFIIVGGIIMYIELGTSIDS